MASSSLVLAAAVLRGRTKTYSPGGNIPHNVPAAAEKWEEDNVLRRCADASESLFRYRNRHNGIP
jgi:hypothetical protein